MSNLENINNYALKTIDPFLKSLCSFGIPGDIS